MFYRLLFVLLLAADLGIGAWLAFGRLPARRFPPRTDAGVPELKLLSEQHGSALARVRTEPARGASSVTTAPTGSAGAERCESIGPFQTQAAMRAAMQTLAPRVPRIQYRRQEAPQPRGYWVYLAAYASREAAQAAAKALSARGVNDYYVVPAGDQQNMISLGVFHDSENAEHRRAQIAALGFAAQVKPRMEDVPVYWIDFAVPASTGFDWHTALPGRSDLRVGSVDCF